MTSLVAVEAFGILDVAFRRVPVCRGSGTLLDGETVVYTCITVVDRPRANRRVRQNRGSHDL